MSATPTQERHPGPTFLPGTEVDARVDELGPVGPRALGPTSASWPHRRAAALTRQASAFPGSDGGGVGAVRRRVLAAVLAGMLPLALSRPALARATGTTEAEVRAAVDELAALGLLSEHGGRYVLGPRADAAVLAALDHDTTTGTTHPDPKETPSMTPHDATPATATAVEVTR